MKPVHVLLAALPLLLASEAAAQPRRGTWTVRQGDAPLVEGSGRAVREARRVAGFDAIEANGPARVEVVVGPAFAVEVEIDDNLTGNIVAQVEKGRLRIEERGSFMTRRQPIVRVRMPALTAISLKGSGEARIEGMAGGALALANQGSGGFHATGRADAVTLALSGSGASDLSGLRADAVTVSLSGSGSARVHAERRLEASVSGSGSLAYSGRAQSIKVVSRGSGSVRRIGG